VPVESRQLILGASRLALGERALIMGIVNATPDSFFDRGRYFDAADPAPAIERGLELIEQGADIIDVGGETAQPSSPILDPQEEIRRVVPVIEGLGARASRIPISVDTYKPAVARAAIGAGACLINDTSGLLDPTLADVSAQTGAGIVCMHIPSHPKQRIAPGYADPIRAVTDFLRDRTRVIEDRGVPKASILVDPGIGFGKKPAENLQLIAQLSTLRALGYPILFACSRRTFLGDLMGGEPPEDRLESTVAVNAVALLGGADILRVHDVRFMAKLARMMALLAPHRR
jgi:dihydropteroate synthase